ncbi:MAG: DUF4189 domain-containing protein [Pseudorhodoplanes sp.]|nr:hypothetical protein [Pseudorhodoplanes sp.]MBW7948706.1 DUF4189 domain-containing protein [Pseudorhodoplanes sp.]GIK81876.1 MAG: hypothetical protein BroJett024_29810 [Alphaproteobacteria bacterium]
MKTLARAMACLVVAVALQARPAQAAGAFAVGDCGAYGHAIDFPDAAQARAAALANCRGKCRVVATMRRNCAAFAIDSANVCGPHGYATATRLAQAQNTALRVCFQYGGKDCLIRAWACDGAAR